MKSNLRQDILNIIADYRKKEQLTITNYQVRYELKKPEVSQNDIQKELIDLAQEGKRLRFESEAEFLKGGEKTKGFVYRIL